MNNHFLFILIVTFFFIACSDENGQIISNTPSDLPDQNYKLNLQSDSGENLSSVTISWNETLGDVTLIDSDIFIYPTSNSHTFGEMTPGEYKDIIITIDNNSNIDVNIYPNPSISESINIQGSEIINKITLYNSLNQQVYSSNINSKNAILSTSNLSEGLYFIQIIDKDDNVLVKKIVIH